MFILGYMFANYMLNSEVGAYRNISNNSNELETNA